MAKSQEPCRQIPQPRLDPTSGHGLRVRHSHWAPRESTGEPCRHHHLCQLQKRQCSVLFRCVWTFLKFENRGTHCRIIPHLQFPNRTFFFGIKEVKRFHYPLNVHIQYFGGKKIKLTQDRRAREKTKFIHLPMWGLTKKGTQISS